MLPALAGHHFERILYTNKTTIVRVQPNLSVDITAALSSLQENATALERIASALSTPNTFTDARALQQTAINDALDAFGIRGDQGAVSLALSGHYSALGTVRLQEDAVVSHDARWMPGFDLVDSDVTGKSDICVGS